MNKQIHEISKKYGEHIFRMSITHLMQVGADNLKNADVEAVCEKMMKETPPNYIMTPEFRCNILRCSVELSQIPVWDILKYIQTDIKIDGATVHPGLYLLFRRNATCEHITACVVPADTDLSTIDEIEEDINKMMDEYEKKHGNYYGFSYKDAVEKAFEDRGIRPRDIEYDMTVYL